VRAEVLFDAHSRTIEEGIAQMARELEEREPRNGIADEMVKAQERPVCWCFGEP